MYALTQKVKVVYLTQLSTDTANVPSIMKTDILSYILVPKE